MYIIILFVWLLDKQTDTWCMCQGAPWLAMTQSGIFRLTEGEYSNLTLRQWVVHRLMWCFPYKGSQFYHLRNSDDGSDTNLMSKFYLQHRRIDFRSLTSFLAISSTILDKLWHFSSTSSNASKDSFSTLHSFVIDSDTFFREVENSRLIIWSISFSDRNLCDFSSHSPS